jgi:hypothetical protein
MAVIVSLRDVIEQMDLMSDEATTYINRKTGELITLTHDELALAEDPEEAEDAPQWQKDLLPKAREVLASEDFIPLPGKFEIHEWSIMERFARSLTDAAVSDELDAALHGRAAFRRFKDAVHRLGIADEWYRFRDAALEEIAIEFLEAHGIAYQREPRQKWDDSLYDDSLEFSQLAQIFWPSFIVDAALTKDILTTKITKATKGSEIFEHYFVLFVSFVVKSAFLLASG